MNTVTVDIHTNRDTISASFPARWVICTGCEGCGTDRGSSVECDGGGFTSSEWADQDDDFKRGYLAGDYDRPCTHCKGSGKVQVINKKAVQGWRQKILHKAYKQQLRDGAEIDAMMAAERRMGA